MIVITAITNRVFGFNTVNEVRFAGNIDAGHILVIMPENVKLLILECRGLPVKMLQDIVHHHGGILGPAHPCGERHLSITRTRLYKKHPEIMENFDFLEGRYRNRGL